MKDYSELTSRIYTQLSPELSQEFHNMLQDMAKEISRLYEIENAKPSEALEIVNDFDEKDRVEDYDVVSQNSLYYYNVSVDCMNIIKQALQRLNKYEQILGNGRLTDRNYKNTTLPIESCKPYLRLGELEDIYEGGKK